MGTADDSPGLKLIQKLGGVFIYDKLRLFAFLNYDKINVVKR